MSESKYPEPFTSEWWELRNALDRQIAERQKKNCIHWTPEQVALGKRNRYMSLFGREPEGDEQYINSSHWQDR